MRSTDDDAKAATTRGVSAFDLTRDEEERADAAAARDVDEDVDEDGDDEAARQRGSSPAAVARGSQPSPSLIGTLFPRPVSRCTRRSPRRT